MEESYYIHPSAIVDDGAQISKGCKVWHFAHVRSGVFLHENVSIGKDVYVDEGLEIGEGTRVQNGVSLYKGLQIAPWTFIGPHVIFTNDQKPRASKLNWKIIITKLNTGVSIGAGAIIRCGVNLGAFSMVAAGSIVTKDVPSFHLALGLPAKPTQMICACGDQNLPLNSKAQDLIRECCHQNLNSEMMALAKKEAQENYA